MSFSPSHLCRRLLMAISKSSVSHLRSTYALASHEQRLCSTCTNAESEVEINFDEFDDPSTVSELLENLNFSSIVGDDLREKKKLEALILNLKMQMQRQALLAPKKLNTDQWHTLLKKQSEKARLLYLKKLYFYEKRAEVKSVVSCQKKDAYLKLKEEKKNHLMQPLTTSSPISYGLSENSLIFRILPVEIKKRNSFNISMAMMFGPDIFIDCSYEEHMTNAENYGCARQILYMWSANRCLANPFNLIFCNLNPNGKIMNFLSKVFANGHELYDYLINFTEKHYLDFYPAKQLVYLSPHCEEELEKYDGESTYIIGGYVDEIVNKPVSLAKAKQDGLRTAKFPLDKHLKWAQGSKFLPINQCLKIMSDLKSGSCWEDALKHVAMRKQVFNFSDEDPNTKLNNSQAALYVRSFSRRNMLRDLSLQSRIQKEES